MEMSFVTADDVCATVEGLVAHIWDQALNIKVPRPFKKMSYKEAMHRYFHDLLKIINELTDMVWINRILAMKWSLLMFQTP